MLPFIYSVLFSFVLAPSLSPTTTNTNEIDLATAAEWTSRWRQSGKQWIRDNNIRSFLIARESLTPLLNGNNDDIRAYFGINEDNELKLVIVGVADDGNDRTPDQNPTYKIYTNENACPAICDTRSPLWAATIPSSYVEHSPTTINEITLTTAVQWISDWQSAGRQLVQNHEIRGMFIPRESITSFLENPEYNVRAYLSINDSGNMNMVLVAVNDLGRDQTPDNGGVLKDFMHPCPGTCDTDKDTSVEDTAN